MRKNTRLINAHLSTKTHEGAPAVIDKPEVELRRAVSSCLLWEDSFYESGEDIAKRIATLAAMVDPQIVADLAVKARNELHLRHAPLMLLSSIAKTGAGKPHLVSNAIERTVQRADELAELLAIYWRDGKKPIPAQFKKGLAKAFQKFGFYALAKYNRDNAIKLRDVMFLVNPKPKDAEQAALWKKLADGELESPDTWEVNLSAGGDKAETFTRLIKDDKLGYFALLRNLRGMMAAGVNRDLVTSAIVERKGAGHVLPFRYIAAARACPELEPAIDKALIATIGEMPALPGKTAVLVDVSGSMEYKLSAKSDLNRADAAAALASIIPGKDVRVFSFSDNCIEVPARKGMAGVDAILGSQPHHGTMLGAAVRKVNGLPFDRVIAITDEQSSDQVPMPKAKRAYMINVAGYKPSVAYGPWTKIEGFSEGVLRFIAASEGTGI